MLEKALIATSGKPILRVAIEQDAFPAPREPFRPPRYSQPRWSMSYKFKVCETFAEGLRRIASEQVNRTAACLQPGNDVHKGVHEARKSLKRLRALLALYRTCLDDAYYQDIDRAFRDMARALSGAREIQGMLDSLAHLEKRFGRQGRNKVLTTLHGQLQESRGHVSSNGLSTGPSGTDIEQALADAGGRIDALRLTRDDFEAIRPGIEQTYRAARHWHERAFEEGTGESFHEWRKTLQRHWRHMQLLTPAWPHDLRARAQLLRAIAETVGQDHDLTVLDLHLAQSGRSLGTAAQIRSCRALCRQRQIELRASVYCDGQRLFAEGAAAFSKRMGRYWRLAGLESDKPSRALEPAAAE